MSDRRRSPRKDPQKEKEDDTYKTLRLAKKPLRAIPRAPQHPQVGDDDDRTPRGPPLKAPTARKVQSGPSTTLPYPQTGPSVKSTSQGQRRRIRKDASAPFSLPVKDMEALKHSSDATPSEPANFSEREPSETESSHSLTSIATITETHVIKNLMDFDQTDTPVNITGFDRYDAPPAVDN